MNNNLRVCINWTAEYRDIGFEIANWDGNKWAYYLYIRLDQMPAELRKEFWLAPKFSEVFPNRVFYDYKNSVFSDLDWHGGITYYEKRAGFDGAPRVVKIGCDYQHFFDNGYYDVDVLLADVMHTIDLLHIKFPGIMAWCIGCGSFFKPNGTKYCGQCEWGD